MLELHVSWFCTAIAWVLTIAWSRRALTLRDQRDEARRIAERLYLRVHGDGEPLTWPLDLETYQETLL